MNLIKLIRELKSRGIKDNILKVIKEVDRKDFVLDEYKSQAYENIPLYLDKDSTISQPFTVAFMLQNLELKPGLKVLEIGAGSGWNAALISKLVKNGKIFTIDINHDLIEKAKEKLKDYKNIKIILGNGVNGYKKEAPYDRIVQTASSKSPEEALLSQLKLNGIYLAPIGPEHSQKLIKIRKTAKGFNYQTL